MNRLAKEYPDLTGKDIEADKKLIGCCGFYCGACRSYLKGKCSGCRQSAKLDWCQARQCCRMKKITSCADCNDADFGSCQEYNGIVTRLFEMVFNYNRETCIQRIRTLGYDDYAKDMAATKRQTLKWKQKK